MISGMDPDKTRYLLPTRYWFAVAQCEFILVFEYVRFGELRTRLRDVLIGMLLVDRGRPFPASLA